MDTPYRRSYANNNNANRSWTTRFSLRRLDITSTTNDGDLKTTLYWLVQEHVETFFAQVEAETGSGLPDFVKAEFDAFLECGVLAHGFLRLRCDDCAHE